MKSFVLIASALLTSQALANEVTYSRHIAPLIQDRCAACHREGGGAPFALSDFRSVSRKAATILSVIEQRFMPPWHAIGGDIPLEGDRRLSDAEVTLFQKWHQAGHPKGDPKDLPPPRSFVSGWQLGEPDLVLTMDTAYALPAEGPDIYRNFVLPTRLNKKRFLKAVEYRPSSPQVVHHSLFYVDTKGRCREVDAADPEPGFAEMPIGEGTGKSIGAWVPGTSPRLLPDGLAHTLTAGSDLVIQIHFHLTGKPEREQSQIALYFTDTPPERPFTSIQLPPVFGAFSGIDLAPDAAETVVTDSFELPVAVRAFAAHPHSHYRGKSLSMVAHLPDGKHLTLLNIPAWDMNWQEEYRFAQQVPLPAGTRLESRIVWDNSADSSANPVIPPVRVRWGFESFDEMGSIDLMVIPEGNRQQAEAAMKKLHLAERDHLVWTAGKHVLAQDKLAIFGQLRAKAIARFDQDGDGQLSSAERDQARRALQEPTP